jgi:hypothetical protein
MDKLIDNILYEEDFDLRDFEGENGYLEDEGPEFKYEIYGVSELGEEILDYADTEDEAKIKVNELEDSFGPGWDIDFREANNLPIDELNDDFLTDHDDFFYNSLENFEDIENEEDIIYEYNNSETDPIEIFNIISDGNSILEDVLAIKESDEKSGKKIDKLRSIINLKCDFDKVYEQIGDSEDVGDFIQDFIFN